MGSIGGSVNLNVNVKLGGGLEQLGKAAHKSIEDIQDRGAVHVDGPGKRYLDERARRADGVMDKLSRGEIIGAALDVFQAFSPGGRISDGAKALGLVKNDADKYLLSGVCNALLLGPLNPTTLADGEDFLKTQLPRLKDTARGFEQLGARPHAPDVHTAPPHFVPSPRVQLRAHARVDGYARARVHGRIDLDAALGRPQFQARLSLYGGAGLSANVVLRGFAHALPRLTAHYAAGGAPPRPGQAAGGTPARAAKGAPAAGDKAADKGQVSDENIARFLKDPTLSFEDKLFLFMLAMAQRQEKKMEAMMAEYEKAKADPKSEVNKAKAEREKKAGGGGETGGGQAAGNPLGGLLGGGGQAASPPKIVQGQDGQPRPTGGTNNSTLGGIVDMVKGLGAPAVRMVGQAAPMAAPALGALLGAAIGSVFPGIGTAIGGMIGSALGDMLAKQVIPQACEQIAGGLERGDYDQLLKFGTVAAGNAIAPGLGSIWQAQDAGLESLLQPFSYLNPAVQSKAGQGGAVGSAATSLETEEAVAADAPEPTRQGGKSTKAQQHAQAAAAADASGEDTDAADGMEGDNSKRSDQEWMMRLQKAQEELSKMYQMVSNMMKAFNDTQMTAVRNLR